MTDNRFPHALWQWKFVATRGFAHVAFAVVAWPLLTIVGSTFAIADLPYYSVSLGGAFLASIAGILLTAPEMMLAGAAFFGCSGLIFRRLGPDTRTRRFGFGRLALEPLLMFLAIICGASLWYPAVLSQPLLTPLRDVSSVVVILLLFGAILLGACVAARPGKRLMLAGVLIAFGALSPLPLRARAEAARFFGSRPDVVLLGLDSISHADDVGEFGKWVERQGGTWDEHAVSPGLLTNAVWASILTMQPVRDHGVFHTFQQLPPGEPAFITAARAHGYRTVSIFPDQLTTAVGSTAGFDEDRSGPVGWRQLLLPIVANNSFLVPILKPVLPHVWPLSSPPNQAGSFTYDVRREIREVLRAGSRRHKTLVAAHLTYMHLPAYPGSVDLSWPEIHAIARAPAGVIVDRSFDWQDVDWRDDPLKLHAWKLKHLLRVVQEEVNASHYLERGGRLVVFSDHGDRAGLTLETFARDRYYNVLLATFGLPQRCAREPISLIDIASLVGLSSTRAQPSVEFALAPQEAWPALVTSARLRWTGEVDLDPDLLAPIFKQLQRYDPWPDAEERACRSAR